MRLVILLIACFGSQVGAAGVRFGECNSVVMDKPRVDFEWVQNYFNSRTPDTEPEEIVDFLVSLRMSLVGFGYSTPTLQELCERLSNYFQEKEVVESLSEFNEIITEKEFATPSIRTVNSPPFGRNSGGSGIRKYPMIGLIQMCLRMICKLGNV